MLPHLRFRHPSGSPVTRPSMRFRPCCRLVPPLGCKVIISLPALLVGLSGFRHLVVARLPFLFPILLSVLSALQNCSNRLNNSKYWYLGRPFDCTLSPQTLTQEWPQLLTVWLSESDVLQESGMVGDLAGSLFGVQTPFPFLFVKINILNGINNIRHWICFKN